MSSRALGAPLAAAIFDVLQGLMSARGRSGGGRSSNVRACVRACRRARHLPGGERVQRQGRVAGGWGAQARGAARSCVLEGQCNGPQGVALRTRRGPTRRRAPVNSCWPSRQPVASVWWEKAPRPSVPPRQPARRHGQRGSWLLLARRGGVQAQRAPARTCAGVSTYSTLSSALTTALLLWCSCRLLLSRRCSAGVAIERV